MPVAPASSTIAATERRWPAGPAHPRLSAGDVHVWRAELTAVDDEELRVLSADERDRAGRILAERKRELWPRSRAVLRVLLGLYLNREPVGIPLSCGPYGKPELGGGAARALSFNLTHSGALALYAFAEAGDVGIDVELARPRWTREALAVRAFGEREARRLELLDPAQREPEFRRLWTRREAEAKCLGTGLLGGRSASGGAVWVTDLDAGPSAAAALALHRPPRILRCWTWS